MVICNRRRFGMKFPHFGMGQIEKTRVETPMERRVRRWAFCLSELLSDETGLHEFRCFLESEFSSENLQFWQSVETLKRVPESQVEDQVDAIYTQFIAAGAPCEINIDSKTMETTLLRLKEPTRYTFDAAQNHIFLLMKKDSYARFLRSDLYKNLITNAINACPKKKFTFYFGSKKRSPNPSPKSKRRGSAGSTVIATGEKERVARSASSTTLSHHSYSTGNLKELDVRHASKQASPNGSSNDIKSITKVESDKSLSPSSIRRRLTDMIKGQHHNDRRRKNSMNLEVPQQYTVYSSSPESSDNETDLRIAVPRSHHGSQSSHTSRKHHHNNSSTTSSLKCEVTTSADINVVAPWETTDI